MIGVNRMKKKYDQCPIDVEIECAIDSTIQLSIDVDNMMVVLDLSEDSDNIGENIRHARKSIRILLSAHERVIFGAMDNLVKKIIKLNELDDDAKAILLREDPNIMRYLIAPSEFLKNVAFMNTEV